MIHSRKSKAVGLFAGSLDSILAFKLVTEQGIAAVALNFRLPFPVLGRVPSDEQLQTMAGLLGVSLVSVKAGDEYLEMVRSPQYGYTLEMAPCIDCMAFMLKRAKELMTEIKADFVFTGEVLGQRPLSQNRRSLKLLERVSGLEGRLLRPLSAKILEPTIPELSGIIRREPLLDFHGRSRRRQFGLAREFGIIDFPTPGAGCLLTDRNFAARCRDAINNNQFNSLSEIEILHYGRHFRLPSKAKVVVGRNEAENQALEKLALPDDVICKPAETVGPVVLLRAKRRTKKDMEIAARVCARYCDNPSGKAVKVTCQERVFSVKPFRDEELAEWRIGLSGPGPVKQPEFSGEVEIK
jgi:tRNA U34 2-thiouridine synthase MnmA/TrmU